MLQISELYQERKIKVLIANDSDFQLLILSDALRGIDRIGVVDQATNGQEALELFKQAATCGDKI